MTMDDMDDIIPEFEARYDSRLEDDRTDTENWGTKDTAGKKRDILISRTYPILRELTHAGARGNTYLIERNSLQSILKFYRPGIVPYEDFFRRSIELSEKLPNFIIHVDEYGFDGNTKRWYIIQEYAKHGSLKDLPELNINLTAFSLVVKGVIEGLHLLHENNIFHLNLKPSNILLRETHPPQPVFTDFSLSSFLEPEPVKKIPPLMDRPLYSSPELLAGIVGREADYWSFGMILLELLLGRNLFDSLDDQSIIKIILAKSVPIPEHIAGNNKFLLRGLLTKDPEKRWGYSEVKRWFEKDEKIPVYDSESGAETTRKVSKGYTVPFRFLNKEYFSIEEMIPAFLKSEEAWEAAKDHLKENNISQWLLNNSDEKTSSKVDYIKERSAGDPDLMIISLIYTFRNDLPFILYGKLISRKNLYIYAGRSLKHENSRGEESIINCLLQGKLTEYYREFLMLTSKADDEMIILFDAIRKAVSKKDNYIDKITALFKMLDILATPSAYMLPANISDNVIGNLYSIAENIDAVITREIYSETIGKLIIPEGIKKEPNNALSARLTSDYLGLAKLKEGVFLTKDEFYTIQGEYILPVWLEADLLGEETSVYLAAVKFLRKLKGEGLLIKKNDFLDYLKKYYPFLGHVVNKTDTLQHTHKGESLEQRSIRFLKYDNGREGYIKLARYIKNNVILSMYSRIEEIIKRISTQSISSDAMRGIIKYLEVLNSGEVPWDDTDKQIVSEINSFIMKKEKESIHFFEKTTGGVFGKILRTFLKTVIGIDADERTRETESALVGIVGGICIGVIAWIIMANLEFDTSFYGPIILGLLLGLIQKSVPLALLFASAGFAGVFFLKVEMLTEVIYAFLISIAGGAKIGAFIGRRENKFSFYDDIFGKYHDKITDTLNAAETASH
jgi:serine/threonine protein kinase